MPSLGYILVILVWIGKVASQNTLVADSQCMYTFNVPPANNNSCGSTSPSADIQSLLAMVTNLQLQVTALTNQSSMYLTQVINIQNKISNLTSASFGGIANDIGRMNRTIDQFSEKITGLQTLLRGVQLAGSTAPTGTTSTPPQRRDNCGGATYIRWGTNNCPRGAKLLHNGMAAGELDKDSGGGADLLCLPSTLQWLNYTAGFQDETARLTGIVYGSTEFFNTSSSFRRSGHYAVLCAVCHVTPRASQLMIPSRKECPLGWTVEYVGYLMASPKNKYRTSFVCVDQSASASKKITNFNTATTQRGTIDYVEAKCGVLNCPPYNNGKELVCVVCTK